MSPMEKRIFGRTGLSVSVLGFGAAPIGYLKTDRARVGQILNFLLDRGVNVIDETVSHRRSEFVLVSKCGHKFPELQGEAWSPKMITQTVDRSLRRLRT